MRRRVICVSRVTGAGGEEVARRVAESLGLRFIDDEIIADAAARGGVSPADVADAERRKSLLGRVLSALEGGAAAESWSVTGIAPVAGAKPTAEHLQSLVVDVIEELAARGEIVIAAHGASFALAARPEVLRVHVTATSETRARRLSESSGVEAKVAAREVRDSDEARADYLRRFYGIESELPTQYDLVVSTDRVSEAEAAEIVCRAAG